jgi:hypothetical protein
VAGKKEAAEGEEERAGDWGNEDPSVLVGVTGLEEPRVVAKEVEACKLRA